MMADNTAKKESTTELRDADEISIKLVAEPNPPSTPSAPTILISEPKQTILTSEKNQATSTVVPFVDPKISHDDQSVELNTNADTNVTASAGVEAKANADAELNTDADSRVDKISAQRIDVPTDDTGENPYNKQNIFRTLLLGSMLMFQFFTPMSALPSVTEALTEELKNNPKKPGKYDAINPKIIASWLWSLRAPIVLLAMLALIPKFVLVWLAVIVLKPVSTWIYKRSSLNFQNKLKETIPPWVRHSQVVRDLGEGADQGLPFVLFWGYLACVPLTLVWMAVHYLQGLFPAKKIKKSDQDNLVLWQNKRRQAEHSNSNFYHSNAFAITIIAVFLSGVPAIIASNIYERSGAEKEFAKIPASQAPHEYLSDDFMPPANYKRQDAASRDLSTHLISRAPSGKDATYVISYNSYWPFAKNYKATPSKNSVVFIHLYLMGLATALTVLFFRAWFLFPLNFLDDDHKIFVTARGIRRTTLKNWFFSVVTLNRWVHGGGPDSLDWSDIKSVRHQQDGFARLHPLPDSAFSKQSLTYKILNKFASFIDGLTERSNTGNYLIVSTGLKRIEIGSQMQINLNDLSKEERARLFYSIKQWAPHVVISDSVQEKLLGSTVLQDVRYTQLWFDLLTSKNKVRRQSMLAAGESLQDGEYVIEERLTTGGQATTYIATNDYGKKCVLKEFVLATANDHGALLESAREFETEVTLLSQLQHPGIVDLIDFFTEQGRVYVALEYVEGESLKQLVQRKGKLSEQEVERISTQICDVLQYLHGLDPPIVHRDVTPENILIQADGTVKLIDFSLAAKSDGRSTTDSCGKQAFTPPEQFREEICPQSDIYGLGATMYFMLTGVAPKPITVSSPRHKVPEISVAMDKIVQRATQLDLDSRFENVTWMKLELEEATKSDSFSRND